MKFTNSPYESMMKEIPHIKPSEPATAPEGTRCHGCPYWKGIECMTCYQELLNPSTSGRR